MEWRIVGIDFFGLIIGQGVVLAVMYYAFSSKVKEIVKKELDEHENKTLKKLSELEKIDKYQDQRINEIDKRVAIVEANQSYVAINIMDIKSSLSDSLNKIEDIWKYLIKGKQ
jgi:hypothetical protein